MPDRPYVTCLMISSIDGRLHPSCYTHSPDGDIKDWEKVYAELHEDLKVDGWMVGRVTMAEMAKGHARGSGDQDAPPRPIFRAPGAAKPFAIAPDFEAQLHFAKPDIGGDAVVVVLGSRATDTHLRELVDSGVSYVVADAERPSLAVMLAQLKAEFGIGRLALEGGGGINGAMIADGLVDELHVLVAPALDGDDHRQGIVIAPTKGLKGRAELSLIGCEAKQHGTVAIRYRVQRPRGSAAR